MAGLTPEDMRTDFENVLTTIGTVITITNHLETTSGLYAEKVYQAGSNVTSSGIAMFLPLTAQDAQVLPQGQVTLFPRKMYVHGSLDLRADSVILDATGSIYDVIPGLGIVDYAVLGSIIHRKAFVRAQVGSEYEYAGQ